MRVGLVRAVVLVAVLATGRAQDLPCERRSFGFSSFVCVCNATYCDSLPTVVQTPAGTVQVFTSTSQADRLQRQDFSFTQTAASSNSRTQTLTVKRGTKYQKVYGFGGAFTDAAGINIVSLPEPAQELLLRSYYSKDGLEYNMGRVPIGGTDFSTREYSYDDKTDGGNGNSTFKLQPEDYDYKIPLIKRAQAMMPGKPEDLLLFSSLWSPPPWMKTNDRFAGFGFLRTEFYQAYADYYIKFFDAYEAEGITYHCVSTGNEPLNGVVPFKYFNSLGWRPDTMHTWIRDYFGPTIRKSKHNKIRIMAHDDQRILLPWMLKLVLADQTTADYIDIVGYHWYLNFLTPSSILDSVHKDYPNKPIISSEACNGDKPWDFKRVQLGSWERAEMYIDDIVEVMQHWTTGWMDWNLALNPEGGPTWAKNFVDSPIIVDKDKQEFYRNPTFYALAHVTKFVPRDSVRVDLASEGGPWLGSKVAHIAFLRPDGGLVIVLVNKHGSSREVVIKEDGRGQVALTLPAKSFTTVIYW